MKLSPYKLLSLLLLTTPFCAADSPIVVEVFTSQGCSSCPPAENLLDFLHEKYREQILPLAYHVDYWDDGGWKDPFSHPDNTQRQRQYRDALLEKDLYTPEMVIQGEVGFVGSDRKRAEEEIRKRLEGTRPAFQVKLSRSGGQAKLSFFLPSELSKTAEKINVVVFENAPSIKVTRGENARRLMSGDFAVRQLTVLPTESSGVYEVPLPLQPEWVAAKTGIAVLVKGHAHKILSAQSIYPVENTHAPGM